MKKKNGRTEMGGEGGWTRRIDVCMGSSCFARGNEENLGAIQRFLAARGIEAEVCLSGRRCEGACAEGPVVTIDGRRHGGLEPGRMAEVLREHFGDVAGEAGP